MKYGFRFQLNETLRKLPAPINGLVQAVPVHTFKDFHIGKDSNGAILVFLTPRTPYDQAVHLSGVVFLPQQRATFTIAGVQHVQMTDVLRFETNKETDVDFEASIIEIFFEQVLEDTLSPYSALVHKIAEIWQEVSTTLSIDEIGLWGDLVIRSSSAPGALIDMWGAGSTQRFDFINGDSALEVKTTTKSIPVHTFSLSQLLHSEALDVVVASVKLMEEPSGRSLFDLVSEICADQSLTPDQRAKVRLRYVAAKTKIQGVERTFSESVAETQLEFIPFGDFGHVSINEDVVDASWSVRLPAKGARSTIGLSFSIPI